MLKPLITDTTSIFSPSFLKTWKTQRPTQKMLVLQKKKDKASLNCWRKALLIRSVTFILTNLNSIHFGRIWETPAQRMLAGKLQL